MRCLITGSSGLVGSAITRRFLSEPDFDVLAPTRATLDLLNAEAVQDFLSATKPDVVIAAAAHVGGISANIAAPIKFLVDNIQIQNNLGIALAQAGVKKFIFLGSSCIYPRLAPQPMSEGCLMTGPLEPTNESYAIAKLAGIQLARAISHEYGVTSVVPIPPNMYGPNDHFDLERAHILSALVRRFNESITRNEQTISIWGTGNARRELMHSSDLADAVFFLVNHPDPPFVVNVGTGLDHSVREIAELVARNVGYEGSMVFDSTKPEGMPRKVLDVEKINAMGWKSSIVLEHGIRDVISSYAKWSTSNE